MGDPYRDTHSRTQGKDKSKQKEKNATQFSEGRQAEARPDLLLLVAKQSTVESARQNLSSSLNAEIHRGQSVGWVEVVVGGHYFLNLPDKSEKKETTGQW